MNLTNLKDKYGKLLEAFKSAGVELTESQRASMDGFLNDLESTINESQAIAIQATANVVKRELESEYKTVVESIIKNTNKNVELASKINGYTLDKSIDHAKLAEALDSYLDKRLDAILPEKTIIDYDRLQTLQSLVESNKETLKEAYSRIDVLTETLEQNKSVLKLAESRIEDLTSVASSNLDILKESATEIQSLQTKLTESEEKAQTATHKLDVMLGQQFLEKQIKDLPGFEAKQLKKKLSGLTESEIKAKFSSTLHAIRENMTEEATTCLEADINRIINGEDAEKPTCDKTDCDPKLESDGDDSANDNPESIDEEIDDGITLDESELINPALMKAWIANARSIVPIDNLAGAK